jgi:predicted PurR-regulated permease PerM
VIAAPREPAAYAGDADGGARRFRFGPLLAGTVLTVLVLLLLGSAAEILLLLFIAILISLYLGAAADAIRRRVPMPRGLALALAGALTLGGVVGLVWLLVPPVIAQTQALIRVLPTFVAAWDAGIDRVVLRTPALASIWQTDQHRIAVALYEQAAHMLEGALPRVLHVIHPLINVFAVGVMSVYLSLNPALYREWLIALFPPVHRELARDVLGDIGTQLRSWIVGQLFAMLVLAAMTAVGLYLLDVPYWLTFGVFTGAVAIVPFFGTLLSTVLPAAFVLPLPNGGSRALLVIALGVIIHLIEGNFVAPLIASRRVEIPPVLSIMSVLIVGKLLGPVGLLVAVPTVAALMVIVRRILVHRVYEGQGFRRSTRDRPMVLRVPPPDGDGVLLPTGGRVVDVLGFTPPAAESGGAAV